MRVSPPKLAPAQGPLRLALDRAGRRMRMGLRWADPVLLTAVRLAEPAALLTAVLTGLALPWLAGDWAPIPAFRVLHLLSGLTLMAVLVYRAGDGARRGVLLLARRRGNPRALVSLFPERDRWRASGVESAYTLALGAMVLTGVEHAWALRGIGAGTAGGTLLGLLSPSQAQSLHSLGAPYFYGALLLLSYVRGRTRARELLAELRSP